MRVKCVSRAVSIVCLALCCAASAAARETQSANSPSAKRYQRLDALEALWTSYQFHYIDAGRVVSHDEGDIKLEAWGDGHTAAARVSYTDATSYLAIFGGWKNRYHVLARMDEHAADRPEVVIEPGSDDPRQQPVLAGHHYRLKLERSDGRTVRFWVDDVELLSFADPQPLQGGGHDHFAFNDWQAPVCFDHLVVEPLPS